MWLYAGESDPMRLGCRNYTGTVVDAVMKTLHSTTMITDPSDAALPLYRLTASDQIIAEMPRFDKWGFLVAGQEGERENPLMEMPGTGSDGEAEASAGASGSRDREETSLRRRRLQISSSSDEVEEVFVTAPARRVDEGGSQAQSERHEEEEEEEEARVESAGGSSSGLRGGGGACAAAPTPGTRRRHWAARDE